MKQWRKPLDQGQPKTNHYRIRVLKERCKGCGFCVEFCPRQVLHESAEFNPKGYHPVHADAIDNCLGCGLCESLCPEFALTVEADHD